MESLPPGKLWAPQPSVFLLQFWASDTRGSARPMKAESPPGGGPEAVLLPGPLWVWVVLVCRLVREGRAAWVWGALAT